MGSLRTQSQAQMPFCCADLDWQCQIYEEMEELSDILNLINDSVHHLQRWRKI
jgi:hypothetical protein